MSLYLSSQPQPNTSAPGWQVPYFNMFNVTVSIGPFPCSVEHMLVFGLKKVPHPILSSGLQFDFQLLFYFIIPGVNQIFHILISSQPT